MLTRGILAALLVAGSATAHAGQVPSPLNALPANTVAGHLYATGTNPQQPVDGGAILGFATLGANTFTGPQTMLAGITGDWYPGTPITPSSDDTAVIQTAINATVSLGVCARILPGTWIVTSLTIPGNTCVSGPSAPYQATIQKKVSSSTGSLITITGPHVTLSNLTIDGNKASAANAANSLTYNAGIYDIHLSYVTVENSYEKSGGFGDGIRALASLADGAHGTVSTLDNVRAINNDASGVNFSGDDVFQVENSLFQGNGSGFSVQNGAPPPGITATRMLFSNDHFINNAAVGLGIGSFTASTGSLGPIPGSNPVGSKITITGSDFSGNGTYGLAVQGSYIEISGSSIHDNDQLGSPLYGDVLFNADHSKLTASKIYGIGFYGIDAGGCTYCTIDDNDISDIGLSGFGGVGINIGGSISSRVAGNHFLNIGSVSEGGTSVLAFLNESGGGGFFPNTTTDLAILNNDLTLTASNQAGVSIQGNSQASVYGNTATLGSSGLASQAFAFVTQRVQGANNRILNSLYQDATTINTTGALSIPDAGDLILLSGTGTINTISTNSQSAFDQKVIAVTIGAKGSGYTQLTASVTFTGGSCSVEPMGTPNVFNDGTIQGVTLSNNGTGCVTAPTVNFADSGTGTGATGTAVDYSPNQALRRVTLEFPAGVTVKNGNKLSLSGALDYTSASGSTLTLLGGQNGDWTELARGGAGVTPYIVSGLPSCSSTNKGLRAFVRDALTPTYLGALTGGSSTAVWGLCNGSAWVAD